MSTTRERVRELLDAGLSVRDVARVLNISTQAAYQHMKSLGITPPSLRDQELDGGEAA